MHQRPFSVTEYPPARSRPATRARVSQHARVCSRPATEKEGGSTIRRTEESNRAASPASAEIEVCAGAVLPGGSCAEPQTLGAVPQPTASLNGSRHLEKKRGTTRHHSHAQRKAASNTEFFNSHRRFHQLRSIGVMAILRQLRIVQPKWGELNLPLRDREHQASREGPGYQGYVLPP